MKSKAPLALMEQLVMVLVFALSAALCLKAFVYCHDASSRCEARDRALVEAQGVVETVKDAGDLSRAGKALGAEAAGDRFTLSYGEGWTAGGEARYELAVRRTESGVPGLGRGEVRVTDLTKGEKGELVRLPFAWQEVSP